MDSNGQPWLISTVNTQPFQPPNQCNPCLQVLLKWDKKLFVCVSKDGDFIKAIKIISPHFIVYSECFQIWVFSGGWKVKELE